MDIGHYFVIIIAAIFINNFVLTRFLGICPYIGVSKKLDSAMGMGFAVTFVMSFASAATWLVYTYLLDPKTSILGGTDLTYLRTIAFIIIIAALVQFVEMVIQKTSPLLYNALGIYLPLITTNCAVLGVALLVIKKHYNLVEGIVYGAGTAIGFGLALVIMAGIREQLELANIPKGMKGVPISLVTAGILALAFMGFAGLV